ncbi:MAG: hypothetical protein PHU06_02300 [Gallionella sp.]|nr:hypothetical protein [Gallionella sp.]MDD4958737.1 hypothetical protein [Gallionella sp.]
MKAAKPSRRIQSKAACCPKTCPFNRQKRSKAASWDSLLNSLDQFSADFMADRAALLESQIDKESR